MPSPLARHKQATRQLKSRVRGTAAIRMTTGRLILKRMTNSKQGLRWCRASLASFASVRSVSSVFSTHRRNERRLWEQATRVTVAVGRSAPETCYVSAKSLSLTRALLASKTRCDFGDLREREIKIES